MVLAIKNLLTVLAVAIKLKSMEIEKAGQDALELFKSGGKQIEPLRAAIKAGENLKKRMLNNPPLATYPCSSPLFALQVILSNIRERHQFVGHKGTIRSVCFSPDRDALATASIDGSAKLWNLQGKCLVTFRGHNDWVNSVSFSPNQNTIATASDDRTAKLWDLQGKCLVTFTGHDGPVLSVCFSPTGDTLATASTDRTAKWWDLQGNLLAEYRGVRGDLSSGEANFVEWKSPIYSVCFSRDGKFLLAASEDGQLRFLPVENLDELLARARQWLGNNF